MHFEGIIFPTIDPKNPIKLRMYIGKKLAKMYILCAYKQRK